MEAQYLLFLDIQHSLHQRNLIKLFLQSEHDHGRNSTTSMHMQRGIVDFEVLTAIRIYKTLINNVNKYSIKCLIIKKFMIFHLRSYGPVKPSYVTRMSTKIVYTMCNKFVIVALLTLHNMVKIVSCSEHC